MRKLFISADMEGCGAVTSKSALRPEEWEWKAARRWMTNEVIAVTEAALAVGYDEVVVADSHGNAHSIDPDLLPDKTWLIRSWPRPLLQMQGMESEGIEACAFVGYHAAATQQDSILAHTYHGGAYRSIVLNGELCSEGYLNAALAGEFGRPVVLVSGDQHTLEDTHRYAPNAVRFASKHSIGARSQMSLSPATVHRKLKQVAKEALSRPLPQPFILEGPFHLEVEMLSQLSAEMLSYLPDVRRAGAWGVRATFERLESAMKFIAFATLYSPTGVIAL